MRTRRTLVVALSALAMTATMGLAGCSSDGSSDASPQGDCPTAPVDVVVSVDQWGDIAQQLGGDCAQVTTVLTSSSIDPHDYEPSPKDAVAFTDAKIVVVNGVDYDTWATKLASTSSQGASVVNAGDVVGVKAGANPHLWYSPTYVEQVADAITARLEQVAPAAKDYLTARRTKFATSMTPYTDLVAKIKGEAGGKTYAATESVFDYMAQAVGLRDVTPDGFARAASNETDPAPGDILAFQKVLTSRAADVLIDNTQTEGSVPAQVRADAQKAGVPVVNVTETVADGASSFQDWQVSQLTALAKALGVDA